DRVARMWEVARPLEDRERAVRQLREPDGGCTRTHGVGASVDHQHRAADAGQELAYALLVRKPRCELGRDQRLGVRLEPPADRVFALLRRVRLGEDLRKEALEEVRVVRESVVAGPPLPADAVVAPLTELLSR